MLSNLVDQRIPGGVAALAGLLNVDADTIKNWFNRPPGRVSFNALVSAFNLSEREAHDFETTWKAAHTRLKSLSEEPGNKPLAIRFLPDPFPPFSGDKNLFVDAFIGRAFSFANIYADSELKSRLVR